MLANDTLPGGGSLTVTAVNGQATAVGRVLAGRYGDLVLNADGSLTYAPDGTRAAAGLVEHFTYTETGNFQTATANLDIRLTGPSAADLALFGAVEHSVTSPAARVYALYEALLHRAPDPLGLENFTAAIQAGTSLAQVADTLLTSAERGGPVADANAYIQGLYANLLHRPADGGGLIYFANELDRGVSQATVAVEVATSAEAQGVIRPAFDTGVFVVDAIDAAVAREYYAVLGRTPDAAGLQSFAFQVHQAAASGGVDGAIQALGRVAAGMLGSSEYAMTHAGRTEAGFVDGLYVGALGRHAEPSGAAFFADQLAHGVSQAAVALEIGQSAEAQVHLIAQIESGLHIIG